MDKKIKCPYCHEEFKIKDNQKYIDCPFCMAEFSLKEKEDTVDDSKRNSALNDWDKLFKK